MNFERPFRLRSLPLRDLDVVFDADVCDHGLAVNLLYIALHLSKELFRIAGNPARFQRACQCAGQSAGQSGDKVIERCRQLLIGLYAVETFDTAMNPEAERFGKRLDESATQGPFILVDLDA